MVEGLLVRYKLCGQYRMGRIACLHATQDGRPYVAVLSSEVSAAGGDQLPILQRIPISSVSATSRFSARQWQQTGRREAAELQATLQLDARLEMREVRKPGCGPAWESVQRTDVCGPAGHQGRLAARP